MTLLFNLAGDPHLLLSVADFRVLGAYGHGLDPQMGAAARSEEQLGPITANPGQSTCFVCELRKDWRLETNGREVELSWACRSSSWTARLRHSEAWTAP